MRICDCELNAPQARKSPEVSLTLTVSPSTGFPRTSATAPEKIHGCRLRTDFSRPAFKRTSFINQTNLLPRFPDLINGMIDFFWFMCGSYRCPQPCQSGRNCRRDNRQHKNILMLNFVCHLIGILITTTNNRHNRGLGIITIKATLFQALDKLLPIGIDFLHPPWLIQDNFECCFGGSSLGRWESG